jgi:hypothetical protein
MQFGDLYQASLQRAGRMYFDKISAAGSPEHRSAERDPFGCFAALKAYLIRVVVRCATADGRQSLTANMAVLKMNRPEGWAASGDRPNHFVPYRRGTRRWWHGRRPQGQTSNWSLVALVPADEVAKDPQALS